MKRKVPRLVSLVVQLRPHRTASGSDRCQPDSHCLEIDKTGLFEANTTSIYSPFLWCPAKLAEVEMPVNRPGLLAARGWLLG
jgi:hypothetical protein